MNINQPEVLAEMQAVFARYEAALVGNDIAVLDELFWNDGRTIRYGVSESLYGIEAIRSFRAGQPAAGLDRRLERTVITTYGRDFATACTLFHRAPGRTPGQVGRQMQSWARMPQGWRVVAAHVSMIDAPPVPRSTPAMT